MPWGAATSTGARWVHRPGGRTSDVGTGSALSHSFAHPVGGRGGSSGLPGVTVHTRSGSPCARPMRPALSSSGRARSAHWSSLAHIEVELVPSVPEQQRPTRLCCRHSTTAVGFGVMGGSQARGSTLGVSLMRITIDTREDRFEDALGGPASCLRSAPLAAQTGGVGRGTRSGRPELRRRAGGGVGQSVSFGNRPGRSGVEEAFCQGEEEFGYQAEACNHGSRRVTCVDGNGQESLRQEIRSTCAYPRPAGGISQGAGIRCRSQRCTAGTVGGRPCLGPGTRDAGTYSGADARQGDLRLPGGAQRVRVVPTEG